LVFSSPVPTDPDGVISERRVSLAAVALVALSLPTLPILHVCNRFSARKTLASIARIGRFSSPRLSCDPVLVGRAVNYASGVLRLRSTTCLGRSQLIWLVLSLGGRRPVIRVGVGAGLGAGSMAHAWVELNDVPVADANDVAVQHPPFDRPLLDAIR
jgi:hypothetical protein